MNNKIIFIAPFLNKIGGVEKTAKEINEACVANEIAFCLITLSDIYKGSTSRLKEIWFKLLVAVFGKTFSFFIWGYIHGSKNNIFKKHLENSTVIIRHVSIAYALILLTKKYSIPCDIVYLPSHFSKDLFTPIITKSIQEKCFLSTLKNKIHLYSEFFLENKVLSDRQSRVVTFSYNLIGRLKENCRYCASKKFTVIRPGVSSNISANDQCILKNTDVAQYLYVGRIDPGKNVEYLLKLFDEYDQNDFQLTIVGDGELLLSLQERYKQKSNIIFLGALHGSELSAEYKKASFLVIPTFYESYGHVISESLCSGTPVIGFDFNGCHNAVSELIEHGDNGMIIRNNSQEAFNKVMAESNRKLMFFNDKKSFLAKSSQKVFSWNNFLSNLLSKNQVGDK